MKLVSFKQSTLLLVACLIFSHQVSARLILTAPPRETAEQGKKLYGPLAEHLTQLLGEEVIYQHPRDWLRYQRDIRRDVYDIIFDGPHFASWRILHLSHTPLAKLPGRLDFYFIAHKSSSDINEPNDLVLKDVCAIPPPNLTSLVLLNVLNSPIREPLIKSIKGGMKSVFKALKNNECVAAVVRQDFFDKKLSEEQRSQFKVIYSSKKIPNQVITASSRVNKLNQSKIVASLTMNGVNMAVEGIIRRFAGKNVQTFISVTDGDYEGQNRFLEGVILGW
ncbi:MAG: PhnD/SsuA/transferrin family substrate-binding protein [Methylococcales bacterium]